MPSILVACEHWLLQYRRTWRGTLTSSILAPLLYLATLGLGLGASFDLQVQAHTQRVDYVVFVAPGLLAGWALQTAAEVSAYPVATAMRMDRTYHGMASSPVGYRGAYAGHLAFIALRVAINCAIFLAVLGALGIVTSWWAVVALFVAVLTGMSCAAPILAFSAAITRDASLTTLTRLVVTPLFLFSGIFYPVSVFPTVLQWLISVTPLWNGAELCRQLMTGHADLRPALLHLLVLGCYLLLGTVAAERMFKRRLTL
ncbi:ABC transporter permease [Micromonospora sp. NPDC049114]|uniref:ABC transporter permease n=1 Tax=unclassified Micromonospora TaxID=2617518 RepID=UPI001F425D61|nr:ABC transporter permease [Micromonospora sp. MH99]